MKPSDRQTLLRLSDAAIPHAEFVKWGKRTIAVIERLHQDGLAELVNLDGAATDYADPEATWQITDTGLAKLGRSADNGE